MASKSLLVAGVPLNRGNPEHYERTADEGGLTNFDGTGRVTDIHTPPDTLIRVHELMHARHTVASRHKRQYNGVRNGVVQITEDCRLHLKHWPWICTPQSVDRDVRAYLANEASEQETELTKDPTKRGSWADFATRFRASAVMQGLGRCYSPYYATDAQAKLAEEAMRLCRKGKEGAAARMLEAAFFPPITFDFPDIECGKGRSGNGIKTPGYNVRQVQPRMQIIELPHTEHIPEATVGQRLATSGSRIYRPALRRPILPQRMFIRRAATEAGGTILIDASSSMGSFDQVTRWCERAPFGTIAYYAGDNHEGWLYVYARDGKRAKEIVPPDYGGNTVDGPAIDWLLREKAPRIMVTDRGFCGAVDSTTQIVRLETLERCGDIKVVDYSAEEDEDENDR